MLQQPVSSDLLLSDGRAHGDEDGKAAVIRRGVRTPIGAVSH
jgi:hypothetical protein